MNGWYISYVYYDENGERRDVDWSLVSDEWLEKEGWDIDDVSGKWCSILSDDVGEEVVFIKERVEVELVREGKVDWR